MNFLYGLIPNALPLNIFDPVVEFFGDIKNFFVELPSTIMNTILNSLNTFFGKTLYYLVVKGLLTIVNVTYRIFGIFAGLTKVDYDGTKDYLINVFFNNSIISNIYWMMACIGMAMMFFFAIIAVIKKIFDIDDKQKSSIGGILKNCFKSILTTLLLSLCLVSAVNATNILMQSVTYLFNNAEAISQTTYIEYDEQQLATMARVINKIGNYSLNPSYQNRYNVNSCFNDIRADLYDLQQQGVFDGFYETHDESGRKVNNWLTMLQSIVLSTNLARDMDLDVYDPAVSTAIINAMDSIQANPNIESLRDYSWTSYTVSNDATIDRALFLMGTSGAAKSSAYNRNPSYFDAVRGPFYNGDKNIYNLDDVSGAFEIGVTGINYVLIALFGVLSLQFLLRSIIACAARIFNLIGLYIVAPPFIATMPLDEGEKFKQWTSAFIIQCFGIFGTVVPMRLMMTVMPIVFSEKLTLFENSGFLNLVAKGVLVLGGLISASKFGDVITGILANNASWQAIQAGNTNGFADRIFSAGTGLAAKGAKMGLSVAGKTAGIASDITGLTAVGNAAKGVGNKISQGWNNFANSGGAVGLGGRMASGTYNKVKSWVSGSGGGEGGAGGGGQAPQQNKEKTVPPKRK